MHIKLLAVYVLCSWCLCFVQLVILFCVASVYVLCSKCLCFVLLVFMFCVASMSVCVCEIIVLCLFVFGRNFLPFPPPQVAAASLEIYFSNWYFPTLSLERKCKDFANFKLIFSHQTALLWTEPFAKLQIHTTQFVSQLRKLYRP